MDVLAIILSIVALSLAVSLINPELFFESTDDEAKEQTFIADEPYDETKPLCLVVLINPTTGCIVRQLVVQVYQFNEYFIRYIDPVDQKTHTLFFENVIVDVTKIK